MITGFRIQALHLSNAADFTFSGGYLGLLSALGALFGIISCCVPSLAPVLKRLRQGHAQSGSKIVDYGTAMTMAGIFPRTSVATDGHEKAGNGNSSVSFELSSCDFGKLGHFDSASWP